MSVKYILAPVLLFSCVLSFGQAKKDTSFYSALTKDNQLVVGVYSGENLTAIKPYRYGYFASINNNGISYIGRGYDDDILAKLKTPEGILLGFGLSYYMQRYSLTQIQSTDTASRIFSSSPIPSYSVNNDHYINTFREYCIGIPLSIGYSVTKRRYTYYFSLGIEFYYNYKTQVTFSDSTTGDNVFQHTYTKGDPNLIWYGTYYPLMNPFWAKFGAYGTLNMGMSYYFTPKLSVAFEPMLRFTNPFAPNAVLESPSISKGRAMLSLNIGLNYTFKIENSGRLLPFNEEKKPDKFSVGFALVPGFYIEPNQNFISNKPFCFSYAFTFQYRFAPRFALESGIAIDNFAYGLNIDGVYFGIPIIGRYDFKINKNNNSVYYIGLGAHIDYYTNIENIAYPGTFHNITTIGLVKAGYETKLGGNYYIDFALGYEHYMHEYYLEKQSFPSTSFNDLPHVFFGSIGLSYRFK